MTYSTLRLSARKSLPLPVFPGRRAQIHKLARYHFQTLVINYTQGEVTSQLSVITIQSLCCAVTRRT